MFRNEKRPSGLIMVTPVVKVDPTAAYREYIRDLAIIYPEIHSPDGLYMSFLSQYRVRDIHRVAEAIRDADEKKVTDALIKEFRK